MCIGERIHIVARFGGKVFGQVQGDAAPLLSLSLSRLLFLFLPFVHSLILLSCAYSPLTILFFLRPSSPTNRLFCQFLAPFLSLFLSLSSTLERAVYKTHEVYVYVCRIHSSSSSTTPCRPAGISGLLVSSRFVSFRFSSPRISLRYARGDLGAQPPTRELVNYFAQRDTSFMLLDPFLSLSLFLRAVHTFALRLPLVVPRAFSPSRARARSACIRYLRRGAIRRQFPSSDKVCIAAAERAFAR